MCVYVQPYRWKILFKGVVLVQQIEANITRIVIRNNGTNMNVSNVCYVFIIIQTILGNVSSVIIVAKLKQSTS